MCGIIGGIRKAGVERILLSGLARMEYRGYDSAGIAVADIGGKPERLVVIGRVGKLRQAAAGIAGDIGIAHTRWATHGAPSDVNAHPIRAGCALVVHNGIIENHVALRAELSVAGRNFRGDTDTETAAHLLDGELRKGDDLLAALRTASGRLQGAYALAAMRDNGDEIVCVRQGSPLLVGVGDDGTFIASDAQALAGVAKRAHYLANGEYARLTVAGGVELWNASGETIDGDWKPLTARLEEMQLGEYQHFMQKEIFAQPDAVAATMDAFVADGCLPLRRFGVGAAKLFRRVRHVIIIACGTSYHAGLVARGWLAQFGVPCRVEISSEYRHRPDPLASSSLCVAVSQSGETADTLLAMRAAKAAGATTMALVNVVASSLQREADFSLCTRAGMEIGVASTKAFTTQMCALLLLTLALAKAKKNLSPDNEAEFLRRLRCLPHLLRKAMLLEDEIKQWAMTLASAKSAVYIGRGSHYPMALEGALKLKEISYIHSEGVAAGELKHGMLALIDGDMPVIGIAPDNALSVKMESNLAEVAARGGKLFVLAGRRFVAEGSRVIRLSDDGGDELSPIVYAAPLQMLAYHVAKIKGADIDKPRNLAKSVTVE